MIKYFFFIFIVFGIIITTTACDASEQPFIISNNLPQPVDIQILCVYPDNYPKPTMSLPIGQKGQNYESSTRLVPSETGKIFTAGVDTGRTGYIIIIKDENGKELFQDTLPRNELIEHKFKLTITEQGIEYSP